MLDGPAASILGEADNAIYFTREQFAARLLFPVPSLVNQFLHFTRAPLTLIHPNIFRILMGCSALNSLYQLGISLVEICFIYTLKLGLGAACLCRSIVPDCNLSPGSVIPLKQRRKGLFWLGAHGM